MKNFYSFLAIIFFAFLFYASATPINMVSTVEKEYENVEKLKEKDTVISYIIPEITPTTNTKQMLSKGDITISCEIIPFDITRSTTNRREYWWADPNKPGYDIIQIQQSPKIDVYPNNVRFKIRIKNGSTHVLKLMDCAIVMLIDGVQYSLSKEDMTEWTNAMVVKQFEKEYFLNGPNIQSLKNPKVIYILVNDVPTEFNEAGATTKKENFEWYFDCSAAPTSKNEKIFYTYDESPVYKENCSRCNGAGKLSEIQTCSSCKGTGSYKSLYDGKYYTCSTCQGNGKVRVYYTCSNCDGRGEKSYPISTMPDVTSSIKYTGWEVSVNSNPIGATVKVINTKTGKYEDAGTTNETVLWYSSQSESFPIILEYKGMEVKVLPYKKGKAIQKVYVDFTSGKPVIRKGTLSY